MKLQFLNKSKKHISSFLVFIFIFSLFSSSFYVKVKTAEANLATESTQLINAGFLGAILESVTATELAIVPIVTPAVVSIAADTKVATVDQVKQSWWQVTVKWVKDSWYQLQDMITQKAGWLKEYVLDGLFWTMANVVIDQFGDAIVDWIRNGFDGSPMFLSDPEGFFRDTANQVSGAIIDDLDMGWLCSPLGKLNLNISFFFPGTNRNKYDCTFNDIAGNFKNIAGRTDLEDWLEVNVDFYEKNIVNAFGSDYRNGGFLMWLFTAEKKNNDLGRTIQTASDAYIAASASVGTEKFNLNLGRGFFGVRKCVEWQETYDIDAFAGASGSIAERKCLKYQTQTPGTLVQDQLNNAANKDLARLQVADEIDEIIGALATTMVGWLLTGGNDDEGVLGYDKDSDYSGSNRDHYGKLSKSQELTKKKSDISGQIIVIKDGNDQYNNALKNYMGVSGDSENSAGIVLSKLKCIRATSTNDTENIYDDSVCLGVSEEIQNIKLEDGQMTEITTDINNIEKDIEENDADKYDDYEITISVRTSELLDEFESKIMMTTSLEEADAIISEYCYSYDKTTKTGTVCGLYTDRYGNTKEETHETHGEEEAAAINTETMNKTPEIKTNELKYSCILNKYTKTENVEEGSCKSFVKINIDYAGNISSGSFEILAEGEQHYV